MNLVKTHDKERGLKQLVDLKKNCQK